MSGNERREFERLRLAKPILALLDGQNALILDIGISGAFVEHYGKTNRGDRFTLLFRWKGTDVEFVAEVAHSVLVRKTGSAEVSHTGLRFTQPIGEAEKRLNDMMATFVGKVLAAQKANATANSTSDSALVELGGARRSRTRGYLSFRFQNGSWSRSMSDSPEQPSNGFTVAGYEDDEELESLCQAYQVADEEGRRLIKLVAELSARTVKKT